MSFLFGKKKGAGGSGGGSRDLDSRTGNHAPTGSQPGAEKSNGVPSASDPTMRAPPPIGGVSGGDSRKGSTDVPVRKLSTLQSLGH